MNFLILFSFVAFASANVINRNDYQKNGFNAEDAIAKALNQYMPDFLSSVSIESRNEFIKIYSNSTIPRSEIENQLNQWAVRNGVQTQWNSFVTEAKAKKEDIIQNLREVFNRLPSIFENVVQVDGNMALTQEEAFKKTVSAFDTIKPYIENIKSTIGSILSQFTKGNQNGGFFGNNNFTTLPDNSVFPGGNGGFPGGNGGFQNGNGGFQNGNNGNQGGNGGFQNGNDGFQNGNNGAQNGNGGFQNGNTGTQGGNGGFQGGNGGFQGGNTGSQNGNGGFQGGNGGFQGGNGGFQGGNGGFQGVNTAVTDRNGFVGNNQMDFQRNNNGQQPQNGFIPNNQFQGQQGNGFAPSI